MSLTAVENFVIVFPDPVYLPPGTTFLPQRVPRDISFDQKITANLQTLSTNDADPDGVIQGLLYVPDIDPLDQCFNSTQAYLPQNVTRQANLPNTDFNIIAVAPWISSNCTKAWLAAARLDPIRAFIFYLPNNSSSQPPPISSPVWDMHDGGQWKSSNPFPVYAVPGLIGSQMMEKLSLYSGNLTNVPNGRTLMSEYQIDPRYYVRVYTEMNITSQSSLPALWVFLLIVVGGLLFVLTSTSLLMHVIQRRRREGLRRRIARGQVDLEALGIKRLTVPKAVIDNMPMFIYTCREGEASRLPQASSSADSLDEIKDGDSPQAKAESSTSKSTPAARFVPSSIATHDYKQHAQPTCPICLEDFESGSTTIRELPCDHIYHPECIDSFLSNNSSLCPMCKKTTLPLGYCPDTITNSMVRRERAIRRLRTRVIINEDGQNVESGWSVRMTHLQSLALGIFGSREPEMAVPRPPYGINVPMRQRQSTRGTVSSIARISGLSRHETAQQRAQEILGESAVLEEVDDPAEPRQSRLRRAIGRIFPGFK